MIFGTSTLNIHAQIPKSKKKILNPKINVPIKNPRIPLSNPFDNTIRLKARNRQHSSFEVETRYGRGSLSYVNKKKIEWFLIYIQGTQMSVHLESYVQL